MTIEFYVVIENWTGAFVGLFEEWDDAVEAAIESGAFIDVYVKRPGEGIELTDTIELEDIENERDSNY